MQPALSADPPGLPSNSRDFRGSSSSKTPRARAPLFFRLPWNRRGDSRAIIRCLADQSQTSRGCCCRGCHRLLLPHTCPREKTRDRATRVQAGESEAENEMDREREIAEGKRAKGPASQYVSEGTLIRADSSISATYTRDKTGSS